jgi:Domain of Unknown Function (DUF1080)
MPGRSPLHLTLVYAAVGGVIAVVALIGIVGQPEDDSAAGLGRDADDPMLVETFDGHRAGQRWVDGERHEQWQAEYDGYGRTQVTDQGGPALSLAPRSARDPEVTHGGLVTTTREFEDFELTTQLRTVRQLRQGPPNPWEVAWVLWHYTDDNHFYSLVLKPNGWELGKEDPGYPGAQRFLASGTSPTFPIEVAHTVRVRQVGDTITVWANGELLTTYTDKERPYGRGRVGLYTEDAEVQFDSVVVRRP